MTFLDLLVQRRIPFRPRSKPGELWLCCPRAECGDTRFRLGVNWVSNKGHCFNCEWKSKQGTIQKLLRFWRIQDVVQLTGIPLDEAPQEEVKDVSLPKEFAPIWMLDKDEPWCQPLQYLRRRGFTLGQMKAHRFGACFTGRFAFRIIMPVFYRKDLRGVVARSWAGRDPKYLNSTGEKSIWNMGKGRGQPLILAEGIFKAMALEKVAGADFRAAALLGHSITKGQLAQIEECEFRECIIWPDPDPQGMEGAIKVAQDLQDQGFKASVPLPFPTRQADETDAKELAQGLRNRVPFDRHVRWRMSLEARKR